MQKMLPAARTGQAQPHLNHGAAGTGGPGGCQRLARARCPALALREQRRRLRRLQQRLQRQRALQPKNPTYFM